VTRPSARIPKQAGMRPPTQGTATNPFPRLLGCASIPPQPPRCAGNIGGTVLSMVTVSELQAGMIVAIENQVFIQGFIMENR